MNRTLLASALAAATLFAPLAAHAQTTYNGNGSGGFGGLLGSGSLTVSSTAGGTVTFTFNPSGGFSGNDVVVYIDSVGGGFTDTSTFSDNGDGGREAISGYNAGNPSRTQVNFAPGFGADYAISFENNVFTGVFGLATGGNNSLNYVGGNTPTTGGPYTVTLNDSDLGITPGGSFNFVASLISTTAYRSNETIGTSVTLPGTVGDTPNAGFTGSTTFATSNTYTTLAPAPEPSGTLALTVGVLALGGLAVARRRTLTA